VQKIKREGERKGWQGTLRAENQWNRHRVWTGAITDRPGLVVIETGTLAGKATSSAMERRRKTGDAGSIVHKAQVVVAQALRAIQVIGSAGVPHHKRYCSLSQHSTANMNVVVRLQARRRVQAQPHIHNNNNAGLRAAAPPLTLDRDLDRALLQKAGDQIIGSLFFPEVSLNVVVLVTFV
jgi:hypothetical protein